MVHPTHAIARLNEKQIVYFWSKAAPNPGTGCLEWTGERHGDKYARVKFNQIRLLVHRVAYFLHNGVDPQDLFVLHSCDNPICVTKDHLSLGSHKENMRDMVNKGRAAKGSRHGSKIHPDRILRGEAIGLARLTSSQVIEVRLLYSTGRSQQEIADAFGVQQTTISHIVTRKTWRHLG